MTSYIPNRQPADMTVDYHGLRVLFNFGDTKSPLSLPLTATLGVKQTFEMPYDPTCTVSVAEDDIKKLCLEKNHSLRDFEAIRLGIKSFLREHQLYVVNGVEYRVRREDILGEIANKVLKGERVPKTEAAPESEAA